MPIHSTTTSLQRTSQPIPKLHVLPVRDVRKLNVGLVSHDPLRRQLVPPLVLPDVVCPQHQRQDDRSSASHDNSDFGGDVSGGVAGAEGGGPDDVAETERNEEDGVHGDLKIESAPE